MSLNRANPALTLSARTIALIEYVSPLFDLGIRLYVASFFWHAGWQKTVSWQSTLELFRWEYSVPLLPPEIAAWLATGIELGMSALLVVGLMSRGSALVLLALNYVAVVSYADMSSGVVQQHTLWGIVLAMIIFYGPGKLSLDYLLRRKFLT